MKILDGIQIANEILADVKLKVELEKWKIKPHLAIIIVGDDYGSKMYVAMKKKRANEVGIECTVFAFDTNSSTIEIIEKIKELNLNDTYTGIMVQLPLPSQIDTIEVVNSIVFSKDVDGLGAYNLGRIFQKKAYIVPATALGVIRLLEKYKISLEGKNAVIIGTSPYIGKPLAGLLLNRRSTVTLCHRSTINLKSITQKADILISAMGNPKMITEDWIKEGAVLIDVGISKDPKTGKVCGDFDFESVKDKCSYITPVPGGVGPMTIASLLENVISIG
ncbi:MAG TPA: bifunctional 5,10-methylenetetrahydrofolate dehydrogenase/5,10-methenyltetrahydrofolate cyclohydrolase [Candidatus Dojkabacteria bacterium]|nr:bifunctional 5,10-methylenetetrahydrofolate dehydrogenase/5,10-methenyltetrahydrofolate cyclohydrolase [Candidatus Dojkabacteria bacterium]HQF37080.1 bifunctional 5,10-methylenetetrahydrofolate dehydrogenase/5,10-methenyltetrahydrofolate cyclohydrolase [Candidatus Dojkabacteria bacterium]